MKQSCGSTSARVISVVAVLAAVTWIPINRAAQQAGAAQESSANASTAAPAEPKTDSLRDFGATNSSLVYFVGTVERNSRGTAIVDLGDAHTLKRGERVAVFRIRDNHFRPLGALVVESTFPTFMQSKDPRDFSPDAGDLVIFMRTVPQLGTAHAMRETFLTNQLLANRESNGYSTVRNMATAKTITRLQKLQPEWVTADRKIAGIVFGESETDVDNSRTTSLLNQIDLLRQLDFEGLPATAAAGPKWQTVMEILKGPENAVRIVLRGKESSAASDRTEETSAAVSTDEQSELLRRIRSLVSMGLFERTAEEQVLATVMCASLYHGKILNEQEWLRRRLAQSQFPRLVEDDQYLHQISAVMRKLRQE